MASGTERPAGDRSGTTLAHYRLIEPLGAGGMGVVYRALDTTLGREVAIKLLPPELASDASARATLMREARTASQLNHPNICTIHEVGDAGDTVYIAMERIDGPTLKAMIPPGGMEPGLVARLGAAIARALAHAHVHGVVHRDLKTANVMVNREGVPKLLDFGLSRVVREGAPTEPGATSTGIVAGTPQYLAPEVLMGGRASAASDVWALGVVLYEMCAGHEPFPGAAVGVVVTAILHTAPEPLPARLGPALRDLVFACLSKEPSQRPAGASDVAVALEAFAAGAAAPVTAVAVPAAAAAAPPAHARLEPGERRTHPLRRVLLAIALLAAVVVAWRYWGPSGSAFATRAETVMVLPLEVRGQVQGAEFAGRAFAEALAVSLAQSKELRVVPVPPAAEGAESGTRAPARIAFDAGAGRLVVGSIAREGDSLRVDVRLIDTEADRVLWGGQAAGGAADLTRLASTLALQVSDQLGAPPRRRYDDFMSVTGPAGMATSRELTDAVVAMRRWDGARARAATERLVARFPAEPEARVLRLAALLIDGRTQPADSPIGRTIAAQLDTLHQLDPNSPWFDVVRATRAPGGSGAGARLLAHVVARRDLTPAARAAVLTMLADAHGVALGDTASALSDAQRAVALNPASDLAASTLARWLSASGRDAEAATRVRQALALNPTVANYWLQLANCELRQGNWSEYATACDEAARLVPDEAEVRATECDGLTAVGQFEQAAACARRALALRPERAWYALQLGTVLMRTSHWSEAAEALARGCAAGNAEACALRPHAEAFVLLESGHTAAARVRMAQATDELTMRSRVYATTCFYARVGARDTALAQLHWFREMGWVEPGFERDPNLASLRTAPEFRSLATWMRAQPVAVVLAGWTKSR